MQLTPPTTLASLADFLQSPYKGDGNMPVSGINEIHRVQPGDITFVDVPKYFKKALESPATVVLINQEVEPPAGKGIVICADPFSAFNAVLARWQPRVPPQAAALAEKGIHPSVQLGHNVTVGKGTTIAEGCEIGHNVVIGEQVTIGPGCVIHSNVTIYSHCVLGRQVQILSGAIIGGDAFYYKKRPDGSRDPMLSRGRVVLHDHVHIGANTTIDRGVTADTTVGAHTKIDNLVQVGHDTIIGRRCLLAAQVGVAGATTIEDDVTIWGQAGIPSGVTIGAGAVIQAQTGVHTSLAGGKNYCGAPVAEARAKWREFAAAQRLPAILQELEALLEQSRPSL